MQQKNEFTAHSGKRDTASGHSACTQNHAASANECTSSEQPGAVAFKLPNDNLYYRPKCRPDDFVIVEPFLTDAGLPKNAIMFCERG